MSNSEGPVCDLKVLSFYWSSSVGPGLRCSRLASRLSTPSLHTLAGCNSLYPYRHNNLSSDKMGHFVGWDAEQEERKKTRLQCLWWKGNMWKVRVLSKRGWILTTFNHSSDPWCEQNELIHSTLQRRTTSWVCICRKSPNFWVSLQRCQWMEKLLMWKLEKWLRHWK